MEFGERFNLLMYKAQNSYYYDVYYKIVHFIEYNITISAFNYKQSVFFIYSKRYCVFTQSLLLKV